DQLSYTISPEYFTKLKFAQFAYADFGWPHRVLAAEVGFLATAGVGLIAGWVLARVGLDELAAAAGRIHILKAMALVVAVAGVVGCLGGLLGTAVAAGSDLGGWKPWQRTLGIQDLPAFVIVAYLHAASYLGGLLGLVCAVVYVRRARAHVTKGEEREPDSRA